MKKLLPFALALSLGTADAQTVDGVTNPVDSVEHNVSLERYKTTINQLFAGVYTIPTFSVDNRSIDTHETNSLRLGGSATYVINDNLDTKATIFFNHNNGKSGVFSAYSAGYSINKFGLRVGKVPTAQMNFLASPVSPGGQLLFTAESQAGGPALGSSSSFSFEKGKISGSLVQKKDGDGNSYNEGGLYIAKGPYQFATTLDINNKSPAVFAGYQNDVLAGKAKLRTMLVYKKSEFSYSSLLMNSLEGSKLKNYGVFVDGKANEESAKVQLGFLKSSSQKIGPNTSMNAKFGAGLNLSLGDKTKQLFQGVSIFALFNVFREEK